MKVSFFYDGPLMVNKQNEFFDTALTDDVFRRFYSPDKDILNVYIRTIENKREDTSHLTRLSLDNMQINSVPNLSSISGLFWKKKEAESIILNGIEQSDIVFVRLPSLIGLEAVRLCRKLNKPFLVEMVGCPLDSYWNHSALGKFFSLPMFFLTKKAVKMAPYVAYVTNVFLQNRYPTNGKAIACSDVNLINTSPELNKKRLKHITKLTTEPVILGTVAAVNVKYKGQEYAIKALSKLRREGLNFKYWVIGAGDDSYLKKVAQKYNVEEDVIFLGAVPHYDIFSYLDKIDIYIQPSKQEGLPRSIVEAMSRGCLVIGSKTGGIPELLERRYIFNKGSVHGIYKIIKSIKKEDLISAMERNTKKAKEFEKDKLINRRAKFYTEFINDNIVNVYEN